MAADLWFDATERLSRIRDAAVDNAVFPIHAEARTLPFATGFFDAIVSIDSFVYYGTDDLYANHLARFLAPGGQIGIAGAGLAKEIDGQVPEHLGSRWEPSMACLHSAQWWRQHWARSGVLEVEIADTMPDGWRVWLDWQQATSPANQTEIDALTADHGRHLGYVRALARRRANVQLDEPVTSVPVTYTARPLLRDPTA